MIPPSVRFQGSKLVASVTRTEEPEPGKPHWRDQEMLALLEAKRQVQDFESQDIPADIFSHLEEEPEEGDDPIRHIGVVSGTDALPLKTENESNSVNQFCFALKGKINDTVEAALDQASRAIHAMAFEKAVQGKSEDPDNQLTMRDLQAFKDLNPPGGRGFPHHD